MDQSLIPRKYSHCFEKDWGFGPRRRSREIFPGAISLEAFAYNNCLSKSEKDNYSALVLVFDHVDYAKRAEKWADRASEFVVSTAIKAVLGSLCARFSATHELGLELLNGGWRHREYDIPYFRSEFEEGFVANVCLSDNYASCVEEYMATISMVE